MSRLVLGLLTAVAAGGARAADPDPLALVPADAAVFLHVDVQTVWASPLAKQVRDAKARDLEKALKGFTDATGLTPEQVKTATFFYPKLKGPGDFFTQVYALATVTDIDAAKAVAGMKAATATELKEVSPGVYESPAPKDATSFGPPQVRLDMTRPRLMLIGIGETAKALTAKPPVADGPLAKVIAAAREPGVTAAGGLTMANMPDELRGDGLPAEARPYEPLFKSDALTAVARLTADKLTVAVSAAAPSQAAAVEAEKSFGVGVQFFRTLLAFGTKQVEKEESAKPVLPLMKAIDATLAKAAVGRDGTVATVTAGVPTDLPLGPAVKLVFGGEATAASASAQSQNNLKQIALAMHNYHSAMGALPPAAVCGRKGKPLLSWRVLILPYVEEDALYRQFKLDEAWDSEHNAAVLKKHPMPKVFALPGTANEKDKTTPYRVFVGNGAGFDLISGVKFQAITDGMSNTLMVATAKDSVPWTKPEELPFDPKADPKELLLFQDGRTTFAFMDGSVRRVKETVDSGMLRLVIQRADGQVIGDLP